jgi:hypothetical protein
MAIEHRVADLVAPKFRDAVAAAFARVARAMPLDALADAVERQRPEHVVQAVPWLKAREMLREGFLRAYRQAIHDAGRAHAEILPRRHLKKILLDDLAVEFGYSFNITNPRTVAWIERAADVSALNLLLGEQVGLRSILTRMFTEGIPPRAAARMIRDTVGLTPQYRQAVSNYARGLLERGYDIDYTLRKVSVYARRLRQQRAETIARTESIRASAKGQQEMWDQAVESGILDPMDVRKQWKVTRDERLCPICAPLSDIMRRVNEPFPTEGGMPPAHPNCRCAVRLVFADANGLFPAEKPAEPGKGVRRTLKPKVKRRP